jgi:hypothetical protein
MYLGKVIIRNIRGFADLEFDLARPDGGYAGWTVFTGDNGSGKSTLLKAIALGLVGKDVARALQPSFRGWIRDGCTDEASIQLEIVRSSDDDSLVDTGRSPLKNFPAKIAFTNAGRDTALQVVTPVEKQRQKNYSTPDRSIWATDAKGWFSCGYGPFRRVFGASPEAARQMVATSTERFVTMFQEAASLAEVDQWLRNLNHKALEHRPAERQQLDLLLTFLRDDLMPNRMSVDRVDSDGLWLRDGEGVQLSWDEMSDGYRAALALLADILRHLINAYGIDDLTEEVDGKLCVKRSGVVLIDEVDAHLHPEWQREIGFWLKRHFPKIQFLVTTHSPIICQAADPNGLFVLPEPGSDHSPRPLSQREYEKVIASRPDTILLTAAFGLQNTRSPRAVAGRAELAGLQAKRRAGAKLTKPEAEREKQLELFANTDEEL